MNPFNPNRGRGGIARGRGRGRGGSARPADFPAELFGRERERNERDANRLRMRLIRSQQREIRASQNRNLNRNGFNTDGTPYSLEFLKAQALAFKSLNEMFSRVPCEICKELE